MTAIHWFRKGLRIHDNPALVEAIEKATKDKLSLRPIFILDPGIVSYLNVGSNRWRFLQETLTQLDQNLRKINSRLYVVRGNPRDVFPKLFKEWNVRLLTFEHDIEPYSVERDVNVRKMAKTANIMVTDHKSLTIFDYEAVVRKNKGTAPLTYQKFLSIASSLKIPELAKTPGQLPSSLKPESDKQERDNPKCYDVPDLKEMEVYEADLGPRKFPGGETEALDRLKRMLAKTKYICDFEKPKTSPNSLEPSTTVMSPYLKFGCLSARHFYVELKKVLKSQKHTQPPVSLEGQLIWREFYYCVAAVTPNFDKMVGNPICCQVPWQTNTKFLEAWKNGQTGYPFIDAIMRQLKQEGWIHHLGRHAVACFLTRGDLWISWEEGQRVFEEYLMDADWALNAGNWMWLSASAFFHQFFRVYSPVAFGKKTDPEGAYIKKYVPELKNYPSGAIYEPWKVGKDVQKKYGCIVGVDYPNRLVIHEDVHKENIAKLSAAYKKNKAAKETGKTTQFKKEEDDSSEEEIMPAKKRKAPSSKDNSQLGAMKKYLK